MNIKPPKGLLDFYNDQVRNKNSLWNKYTGLRSISQGKEYTKSWDQLSPHERWNLKTAYENFKKYLPTYKRIARLGLIPVEEAGQVLEIPEVRTPPLPNYPKGRMTSGFPITISDAMTRGTGGSQRGGSGKKFIESILKPKFKLQQIDTGGGSQTWFMKNPKDIEGGTKILQDFYLRKGSKYGISPQVLTRVKQLHRNPTIIELLKKGNYLDGKALAAIQNKWGWTPSEASTATFRLAQVYNGKKFMNVDVSLSTNKAAARSIFEAIEKAPWNSAFHSKGYLIAMDTITENLGSKYFEKASMDSFKRYVRQILTENKIPVYDPRLPKPERYGFNLNEMIGTSPTLRTGAHPYSQFVNLMEGKFNQGHYAAYVKDLGNYQLNLQDQIAKGPKGDPGSIIKQFNKYNTEFKDIHGLKTGDLPTLSLKDPSKLYSATRLKELSAQGLDLPEHFKKAKYSIGVGEAPTLKEVVNLEKTKRLNILDPYKVVNSFNTSTNPQKVKTAIALGCLRASEGGRIGYALGTATIKCVNTKLTNEPVQSSMKLRIAEGVGKIKPAATNFLKLLGRGGVKALPFAGLAAAGAAIEPLVKFFRSDDPSTYLTDESQMKGMLLATIEGETPKVDEELLKWQLPAIGAGAAAAVPGSAALMAARKAKGFGLARQALGPLGKVFAGTFSPLAAAATTPLHIAAQRKAGTEWGDIATDPTNWMGAAFAGTGARMATRGMNPTGILSKALRLGYSPRVLRAFSSKLGWPGLMITGGMWGYDKWKNRSINDED